MDLPFVAIALAIYAANPEVVSFSTHDLRSCAAWGICRPNFWGTILTALHMFRWMAAGVFALLAVPAFAAPKAALASRTQATPKPGHVFIIVLENEGYRVTFGRRSPATYLKTLARQGALLPNYYGIGHNSLDNYIAIVSGQAPNPTTQSDCHNYVDFDSKGTTNDGQAIGAGCIYPPNVLTIVDQLKGLSWKGYMEDMGNDPKRESATCGQPIVSSPDSTQHATPIDQYAGRHNPFIYFHSIVDDAPGCAAHAVNSSTLTNDLQNEATTPNYAFITPNLCHDGHDAPCADGQRGGLASADKFLKDIVPNILASPAYKHDGLLIITFDEADIDVTKKGLKGDASACCHEPRGPNIGPGAMVFDTIADRGPGIIGPGGGRIGAVLLSPFIKPGTISKTPYNHYSLLRSIEDFFDVGHLGYAGQAGLRSFGKDIFTAPDK